MFNLSFYEATFTLFSNEMMIRCIKIDMLTLAGDVIALKCSKLSWIHYKRKRKRKKKDIAEF